jgi:hypothetical protein
MKFLSSFPRSTIVASILLLAVSSAFSQSKSIRVGVEVPFQTAVGFENQFHEWFSFHGQFGVISVPWNNALLRQWRGMGMSNQATDVLEPAFEFGTVAGLGARYYFNKHTVRNYVGPIFFYVNNYQSDISDISVARMFNKNMHSFPLGPIPQSMSAEPLTISTKFIQLGLQYGYRIKMRRDDREIRLELNISKNLWSRHFIESDYRYLGSFKETVNQEFKTLYKKHAYITTVNLYYIIKTEYKRF